MCMAGKEEWKDILLRMDGDGLKEPPNTLSSEMAFILKVRASLHKEREGNGRSFLHLSSARQASDN